MEKHSNDRKPHADRGKVDLSKKVERKDVSASRKIHTSAERRLTGTADHQTVKNTASMHRALATQASSKGKVDLSKKTENKTANYKTVEINAPMRKKDGKVNLSKEAESKASPAWGTIHAYDRSIPVGINAPTRKHKRELAKKIGSTPKVVEKLRKGKRPRVSAYRQQGIFSKQSL